MSTSLFALAHSLSIFAQVQNVGGEGPAMIGVVIQLAIAVFTLIGMWKTFVKAGEPGWACIIPIYNLVVLCRIAGKSPWLVLLILIPFLGILIFLIVVSIDVAKNFGQGAGFGLGLAFLGFIFYPILGFGDARYQRVA